MARIKLYSTRRRQYLAHKFGYDRALHITIPELAKMYGIHTTHLRKMLADVTVTPTPPKALTGDSAMGAFYLRSEITALDALPYWKQRKAITKKGSRVYTRSLRGQPALPAPVTTTDAPGFNLVPYKDEPAVPPLADMRTATLENRLTGFLLATQSYQMPDAQAVELARQGLFDL